MEQIDEHNLKVICQGCGETGIIDNEKPQQQNGFFLMINPDPQFEYHLCYKCYAEWEEEAGI